MIFLELTLSLSWVSGMYKWLATKYPEKSDQLRKAHQRNYDAWNRLKLDPTFTEADYWRAVISNGTMCTLYPMPYSFSLVCDIVEALTETVDDMKRYLRESLQHFPEVLHVVREVKSRGYVVGIVSNHATEWFEDIAAQFGFYDVFPRNYTIVSQDVRAAKPDHKIMDIFLDRLFKDHPDLQRHEVVFIDDKLANVDAAKEYGFHGIQFDALVSPAEELRAALKDFGVLE